jgi:hypothetical protein
MKKWLGITVLCSALIYGTAEAIMYIFTSQIDGTPSAQACSGAFNLSSGGIYQFPFPTANSSTNGGVAFGESGIAYVTTGDGGAPNWNIYKFLYGTFAAGPVTAVSIDINPLPDAANSQASSHYNSGTLRYVNIGRLTAAPCNITSCLHIRTYNNMVVDHDVSFAGVLVSGGTFGVAAYDSTYTWFQWNDATGFRIGRFETATYNIAQNVLVDAGAGAPALTVDGSYVYGTFGMNNIIQWARTDLTLRNTYVTPFLGLNSLSHIVYDSGVGALWVSAKSNGASANVVYKVSTTNPAGPVLAQINLANNQFIDKVLIDNASNKLYLIINLGTTLQVIRVNRTTLAIEQTFTGHNTAGGPNAPTASIDTTFQRIMVPFAGGGGSQTAVQLINLCA